MGRNPDFIGLGAQKSGTSWIYTCLSEHPEVYMPVKEVQFFSQESNWSKGYGWYEDIFEKCPPGTKAGEFSTSYLVSADAPQRIYQRYSEALLVASLRNPINRAFSNYMNDIMYGVVEPGTPFQEALTQHSEYIEQGLYTRQIERYLKFFPKDNILILIYEDSLKDPLAFIQAIYRFLEVDDSFIPSMLNTKINVGRVPRSVQIDNLVRKVSSFGHYLGLNRAWRFAKRTGLVGKLKSLNTRQLPDENRQLSPSDREFLYDTYKNDIQELEGLLGRELEEWRT